MVEDENGEYTTHDMKKCSIKRIYICINPNCDSYLDEVERPSEAENPICNDCGEKLEEEY